MARGALRLRPDPPRPSTCGPRLAASSTVTSLVAVRLRSARLRSLMPSSCTSQGLRWAFTGLAGRQGRSRWSRSSAGRSGRPTAIEASGSGSVLVNARRPNARGSSNPCPPTAETAVKRLQGTRAKYLAFPARVCDSVPQPRRNRSPRGEPNGTCRLSQCGRFVRDLRHRRFSQSVKLLKVPAKQV